VIVPANPNQDRKIGIEVTQFAVAVPDEPDFPLLEPVEPLEPPAPPAPPGELDAYATPGHKVKATTVAAARQARFMNAPMGWCAGGGGWIAPPHAESHTPVFLLLGHWGDPMPDQPDLTPRRMRYAAVWRVMVAVTDILYGGVFVLGGTAHASYQQLLKPTWSMQVWGALLVLAGAFFLSRYLEVGGVLGAVIWTTFCVASVVTEFQHTAETASGPILLAAFALFHLLITYAAAAGLSAKRRR
jgi:hypothetical protein